MKRTSRTSVGDRTFSAAATSVWNSLLAGNSPFFVISDAVPKVAEDETVYTILRRLIND